MNICRRFEKQKELKELLETGSAYKSFTETVKLEEALRPLQEIDV